MRPLAAGLRRLALVVPAALGLSLALTTSASGHPLGNFTINHYAGLRVGTSVIMVDFVLDMAEIPTFQERTRIDANGDGTVDAREIEAERLAACPRAASQITLTAGGVPLTLQPLAAGLTFPIGTSGLETMRVVCEFSAQMGAPITATTAVTYQDNTWSQRIGWREIVAVGDGVTISPGGAPSTSASGRLTSYPRDLLAQPLAMQSATLSVSPGGSPSAPFVASDAMPLPGAVSPTPGPTNAPPSASGFGGSSLPPPNPSALPLPSAVGSAGGPVASGRPATSASVTPAPSASPAIQVGVIPGGVTDEISRILEVKDLTPVAVIGSLLVAAFLGALHAVSPGHGKTVMAAYLVGSRGSARHAIALGLTVTVSHTLGVMALALVTLFASNIIPPERLYPILGLLSGALVVGIGVWLLYGRYRIFARTRADSRAHDAHAAHDHEHDLAHAGGLPHDHGPSGLAASAAHSLARPPELRYGGSHARSMAAGNPELAGEGRLAAATPTTTAGGHSHADGHAHDEPHDNQHASGRPVPGEHSHGGFRHTHLPPSGADLTWRSLFTLGLAGGLVPSASALLLLLGSLAANRPAYGLVLVIAFGLGMAIVLAGVGFLLVYASRLVERIPRGTVGRRLWDVLPVATAVVVIGAGIYLTSQALTQVF